MGLLDPIFDLVGKVTWPLIDRQYITDVTEKIITETIILQEQYFQENGEYWQGIQQPNELPTNGATKPTDRSAKPTNLTKDWNQFYKLPDSLPCYIRIDTYDSPTGKGYTVTAIASYGGSTFQKITNFGSETYRDQDWNEIKIEEN